MSEYTEKEIKESLEKAPSLFKGVTDMYNRNIDQIKRTNNKRSVIIGGVCAGIGFATPKIYFIIIKLITILT